MTSREIIHEAAENYEGPGVDFGTFIDDLKSRGVKVTSYQNYNSSGCVHSTINYTPTKEDYDNDDDIIESDKEAVETISWARQPDNRFIDMDLAYKY